MPKSSDLPIDLNIALAHGLRPDWFMRDRLGKAPDAWQAQLLRSKSRQVIINAGRQIGKSTVVAAAALHCCLYQPGALVLVIAPSQRQSRELFIKIHDFLSKLETSEELEEETKLSFMMANGYRAVVLPGDGRTIRGYSSPALILMDEAAFIPDEVFDATIPMLAASPEGRIFLLSTPYTPAGFFYQIWHNADDWERYEIPTSDCPRVSKAWLEGRRKEDPLRFSREYECTFSTADEALFTLAMLDAMVAHADDFRPFTPSSALARTDPVTDTLPSPS
jgi:Terminase large subunit, T4likevirus-type, N-terminal